MRYVITWNVTASLIVAEVLQSMTQFQNANVSKDSIYTLLLWLLFNPNDTSNNENRHSVLKRN